MKIGSVDTTFKNMKSYWIGVGVLLASYFLLNLIKSILLSLIVINSNKKIHSTIINCLLRGPCSFFDAIPVNKLKSKFSSDLKVIDDKLALTLIDSLEDLITCLILIGNAISINYYFIIPGFLNIVFVVVFYLYCKNAIILVRHLDLKLQTPIFNIMGETMNGLTQIKVYNRRF